LAPSKPSHKVESWNLRFQFKRSFQNQNINHIHHLTFIRHGRSLLPVLLQPLLHLGSGLWPKPCQGIAAQLQALTPKKRHIATTQTEFSIHETASPFFSRDPVNSINSAPSFRSRLRCRHRRRSCRSDFQSCGGLRCVLKVRLSHELRKFGISQA
jgi:hypothetical protein